MAEELTPPGPAALPAILDTPPFDALLARIGERTASVVVVGLGFAGLPQAVEVARAGFHVHGYDIDADKVSRIRRAEQDVHGVAATELRRLQEQGRLHVAASPAAMDGADVIAICAPTELTPERRPDLLPLARVVDTVRERLRAPALVVLESTPPPGTTRHFVLSGLSRGGRQVGRDFWLAFSPERIDPGNPRFGIRNTPRLVAGITPDCRRAAAAFYGQVVEQVEPVSSPEVAEMAKALENTFRFLNISFVNEVTQLCDRLGIDVWDVVQAAATKPYAFMPHYPGPGVGGACIPVVPQFLAAAAVEAGLASGAVEWATRVNDSMPAFIADKLARLLGGVDGARLLLIGVTYKPGIADLRESPAAPLAWELRRRGARVAYHDPLVLEWQPATRASEDGRHWVLRSTPLDRSALAAHDCVVIVTPHSELEYELILQAAPLVFDTRNAYAGRRHPRLVRL